MLLPDILTLSQARATLRQLAQALTSAPPDAVMVIDAAPLRQFDTSVLAVLLACRRLARAHNKDLRVQAAPAQLLSLAKLYGVDGLLFEAAGA